MKIVQYEDLYIKTYLIGYSKQGESCIFLMYSNKPQYKIHFSMVIDSYCEQNVNKTMDILHQNLDLQKLDMLIWTHPHADHYKGIENIIDIFCDKRTNILIPCFGNNTSYYDNDVKSLVKYIETLVHNRGVNNQYRVKTISDVQILKSRMFQNIPKVKELRFEIISPYSELAYCNSNYKCLDYNRMSIGMVIQVIEELESMRFLYTGDMDERTIEKMIYDIQTEEVPGYDKFDYIKIPHHGSRASGNLLKLLSDQTKSEFAASTVYISQELPSERLLAEYTEKVKEVQRTDGASNGIVIKEYKIA